MPIYEYHCNHCQHQLEILQKISDAPETQCPKCQKDSLQKWVSSAGFQLKGNGWYVTDFKDKNHNKPSSTSNTEKTDAKTETTQSEKTASSDSSNT